MNVLKTAAHPLKKICIREKKKAKEVDTQILFASDSTKEGI